MILLGSTNMNAEQIQAAWQRTVDQAYKVQARACRAAAMQRAKTMAAATRLRSKQLRALKR
jgi:hypothetical protein